MVFSSETRRRSIVTANALFFLSSSSSSFRLLFPLPHLLLVHASSPCGQARSTWDFNTRLISQFLSQHFLEIWTRDTKLDPFELKMEDATAIFQKNGAVSQQLQRRYTYVPRHIGVGATNSSSSRPYSTQRICTVSSRKKMQKMQNLVIDIDYLKNQDTTICGIKQSGRTRMNVIYDKV